ncbi:MAG: hemolysin III family protein [Lachnospiraceae bacterium]|nr:hemolysin III family protein [Lachnospiraceae bacterium]
MTRTKLADRVLPDYTKGEELANMITHIIGGVFGIVALIICVVLSARNHDGFYVVGSAIYGASLIILYTMSSVYHGLRPNMGKRVMQVIDHCTIYFLIGGTYSPIVLGPLREVSPGWGWSIFGVVWGLAIFSAVLTAIDLKKYAKISMIGYIGIGWCIVIASVPTIKAVTIEGFMWLLGGGIAYTVGAILYGLGKKKRYMHSIFHVFVLLGTVLQFVCIYKFAVL